jgi:YfiH family protein
MGMMVTGKFYMLNSYLKANWSAPKNVKTLITTRTSPDDNDFNLALHVGDNPKNVIHNRQMLSISLPNEPKWLSQTHTNLVLDLDKNEADGKSYDAAITTTNSTVCVVMTADCIPILITNTAGSFAGAIHAGWRGVQNNIISNTISQSKTSAKNIIAYIGPAICAKHFEVGSDVFDIFFALDTDNKVFFTPKNNDKFECDLISIAKLQLVKLGVLEHNIYFSNLCTYCKNDLFYSYRKEKNTGRFASTIWLE